MAPKKKAPAKRKTRTSKKPIAKRKAKPVRKAKAKLVRSKKKITPKRKAAKRRRLPGVSTTLALAPFEIRGLGAASGGQSGDTQGLSGIAATNSESVEELMEEGQSYEAEVISGVEGARDPDDGEVETQEVPEDDVPEEYRKSD